MSEKQLSECPNCKTLFHVETAQLAIADGMVRCGSCMHIFNATEHLYNPTTKVDIENNEDDWLIDDNFDLEKLENSHSTDEVAVSQEPILEPSTGAYSDELYGDEFWQQQSADVTELDLGSNLAIELAEDDVIEKQEKWVADLEQELTEVGQLRDVMADIPEEIVEESEDDILAKLPIDDEPPIIIPPAKTAVQRRRAWFSHSLWSIAIITAISALLGQFIYYNYERLAQHPESRNYFSKACEWLGCDIPKQQNIALIQASNLMVRTHPKAENILQVDLIITNNAAFSQPFPNLTLEFSNLKNKVIAGRKFKPDEYLAGELLGSTIMPSKQPVHISLEIMDPGRSAVNYNVRISSDD